ncbi:hypothetical protein HDU92_001949, partial [Lobulomyces angularis]
MSGNDDLPLFCFGQTWLPGCKPSSTTAEATIISTISQSPTQQISATSLAEPIAETKTLPQTLATSSIASTKEVPSSTSTAVQSDISANAVPVTSSGPSVGIIVAVTVVVIFLISVIALFFLRSLKKSSKMKKNSKGDDLYPVGPAPMPPAPKIHEGFAAKPLDENAKNYVEYSSTINSSTVNKESILMDYTSQQQNNHTPTYAFTQAKKPVPVYNHSSMEHDNFVPTSQQYVSPVYYQESQHQQPYYYQHQTNQNFYGNEQHNPTQAQQTYSQNSHIPVEQYQQEYYPSSQ